MKCQICKENEATVHFTEIEGSEKRVIHLCDECAREKSGLMPKQAAVSLNEIISSLIPSVAGETAEMLKTKCPVCGITYMEFKSSGRLGCATDYVVFKKALHPLLQRLHQADQHVGKVPSHMGANVAKESEVLQLKRELDRAVQREDYERAAKIRDRIHEITGRKEKSSER
jgi:protein arginine kinase activator